MQISNSPVNQSKSFLDSANYTERLQGLFKSLRLVSLCEMSLSLSGHDSVTWTNVHLFFFSLLVCLIKRSAVKIAELLLFNKPLSPRIHSVCFLCDIFFLLRVYFYVYVKECLYHYQTTEPYLNLCVTVCSQQITATAERFACKDAPRPPPKVHQALMKGTSLGFRSQPVNRNMVTTHVQHWHVLNPNHEAFLHETKKCSWAHPTVDELR